MKRIAITIAASLLAFGAAQAQDQSASSMGELLNLIEQGKARDTAEARQREARFQQARNEQQQLLNQSRAQRTQLERESSSSRNRSPRTSSALSTRGRSSTSDSAH